MSVEASQLIAPLRKIRRVVTSMLGRAGPDPSSLPGHIDGVTDGIVVGWVREPGNDNPAVVNVLLDGRLCAEGICADYFRRDLMDAGIGDGRFGFSLRLPKDRPSDRATLEIRSSVTNEILLRKVLDRHMLQAKQAEPKPVHNPPGRGFLSKVYHALPGTNGTGTEGRLESATVYGIRGWATDVAQRGRVFDIDIFIDGAFLATIRNDQTRGDLLRHGKSEGLGGFQIDLPLKQLDPGEHTITALLPGGAKLSGTVTTPSSRNRLQLNAGLPPILLSDTAVIVPIYNAADDLEICIERLSRFTPEQVDILLINDASPDPRIADILDEAGSMSNVRVLTNDENMGFTRTINRGLVEIGDKHAILLNSDARVTPGWVEGMVRAAMSRPRVSTVTAMSDRAGAFSAPKIGNENTLPAGVDEITYARAFRQRSLALYPVVPTGNGFCMFVNRDCINEIGALDAEAFPRGYGEENDFCMRAGRAGWTHLVDDRTYVFHDRSKSFGSTKTDLLEAGRKIIDARYPEYKKAIGVFTSGPSLALARMRAGLALSDCSEPKAGLPSILYVVATQSGGTPQTNMDLMQEISEEMSPWLLHCDSRKMTLSHLVGGKLVDIRTHHLTEPVEPISHRSGEYDAVMRKWLDLVDPEILHIRHIAWHSLSLPELAKKRGTRVVFSFHDFYALCPTVKLLDENKVFCGATCTATNGECAVDLWQQSGMPPLKNAWVSVWRTRFAEMLQSCDAYITTSESARERIETRLGLDPQRFHVIPHGRSFATMTRTRRHPLPGEPIRILLPGNINEAKGRDIITALLEHDTASKLEIHVLGNISEGKSLEQYGNLIQHGSYKREEFAERVAQINPHLGAVFSIWDETYCHTLTELWSTGVPALVFDFPTVAGRVRASGAGWVVPHEDVRRLYDRIIEISRDEAEQARADRAIIDWQSGEGAGSTTKLMAARYRAVYAKVKGVEQHRPFVAVLSDASKDDRMRARTMNDATRECIFVDMTPESLLANLRVGSVDLAIMQLGAIPSHMVATMLQAVKRASIPYILDIDDDPLRGTGGHDVEAGFTPDVNALEELVTSAAKVTVASDTLQHKIALRNPDTILLPNRLSEQLWRGILPERETDGVVRALYVARDVDKDDFNDIAPALEAVAKANPDFRVVVIGIPQEELPAWAESMDVPPKAQDYAGFVGWLKIQSKHFDFAIAPMVNAPSNHFKSDQKALEYSGLGLPVLAADMPAYRGLEGETPELTLVSPDAAAWQTALHEMIKRISAGDIARETIRRTTLDAYGLSSTLPALDEMLHSAARSYAGQEAETESKIQGGVATRKAAFQ